MAVTPLLSRWDAGVVPHCSAKRKLYFEKQKSFFAIPLKNAIPLNGPVKFESRRTTARWQALREPKIFYDERAYRALSSRASVILLSAS